MEKESSLHIFDYLHLLRRRRKTLAISFFAIFLLVCLINIFQKPIYRTRVELMVERDPTKVVLGNGVFAVDMLDDTFFLTQNRVLGSKAVAEAVIDKASLDPEKLNVLLRGFGLPRVNKGEEIPEKTRGAILGAVQGSLVLEQVSRTRILNLVVTGRDRQAITYLANWAAEAYIQVNAESQVASSDQMLSIFTVKLQELKDKLNLSEFAVQKVQLELKLAEMLKNYEDKHPDVIRTQDQINHAATYLKEQMARVRQALGQDEEIRKRREGVLFSYLANAEARQGQGLEERRSLLMFLEQEAATNREMYNSFFKKVQEMNLTDQRVAGTRISIIQRAEIPGKPLRPNKPLNLLFGCVVGITLGIGISFLQDYLDNSIKTAEDVSKYLQLNLLGIIPAIKGRLSPNNGANGEVFSDPTHRLMTRNDMNSPLSEAYRTMRTNILLASVDKPLRTIVLTSSVQKEGKSTTAINLAISIARSGSSVLLVDADLRRPILARTFHMGETRKTDIVDVLVNGAPLDDALMPSGIENLTILPCFKLPPNPSELLGSSKMAELVGKLKQRFDLVLLDAPPLIAVTDAVVLSSKMDGTLFVVGAGKVPRGICMQAKASLEHAKCHILGVALNGIQVDHGSYNYYQYHRYYNNYGSSTPSGALETLASS